MTAHVYDARLRRAGETAAAAGLAGLAVTPGADLVYLTGYAPPPLERLTLLVVGVGRDPVMLVPALESPAAASCPVGDRIEIVGWADGEDPYERAAALLGSGPFAITDSAWASHLLGLQRAAGGCSFVSVSASVPHLRAIKDEAELNLLRRVAEAADRAFAEVLSARFGGRSEREVAEEVAAALRRQGHEEVDFTIVGSGPNGASPHHEPGSRRIERGDAVVLDFGGRMDGYCSDITRTVVVGAPEPQIEEVYEVVRTAQQAAFEAIAPGVPAERVDAAARAVIAAAGYGGQFVHRTGHGIGLEVHEPPYIVAGNPTPLRPGMTFSIEPGIYLPNRFGVRIEDIVAVTDDGAVRLNQATRDLQTVA
ncbi:MAG TPA: aminopeptidase P family protein [Actinomycetota bacterium]|nr:aminopeptidase P family protein [Actinomycetota bacterium]